MNDHPDLASVLYIDGHVVVYFGHQTKMPKRYVARLK
jgi:prepilin-type processing-associated H-X9-DG protein